MKISYVGKKIEIGDALKEKIQKKLAKIDKVFSNSDAKATITLTELKKGNKAEILISSKDANFKGETICADSDVMIAVNDAADAVIRQIRKYKTKLERKYKNTQFDFTDFSDSPDFAEEEFNVIKQKKFNVKPMDVDEAILQMNLLSHQFFVFRNTDDNNINVVYKRNDGGYGLIEIE